MKKIIITMLILILTLVCFGVELKKERAEYDFTLPSKDIIFSVDEMEMTLTGMVWNGKRRLILPKPMRVTLLQKLEEPLPYQKLHTGVDTYRLKRIYKDSDSIIEIIKHLSNPFMDKDIKTQPASENSITTEYAIVLYYYHYNLIVPFTENSGIAESVNGKSNTFFDFLNNSGEKYIDNFNSDRPTRF